MRALTSRNPLLWLGLLLILWLLCSGMAPGHAGRAAQAAEMFPLRDRLQQFPHWTSKPPVSAAEGDLIYPDGFLGEWQATTRLVDLAAPLAPDIVTPGFEANRAYLEEPITFEARFVRAKGNQAKLGSLPAAPLQVLPLRRRIPPVVADRAFNGLNLTRAYLEQKLPGQGDLVQKIKVDPDNPNRQVTLMKGDRLLEATITGRATEFPAPGQLITSEVFQQVFRGLPQPYLNEVESTTAYRCSESCAGTPAVITADQATAIYLSPQDPDFFKAGSQPIALYRYEMVLERRP
ncbi:MAG: DUF6816 family protein [Cyanobacteria bacterium P01_A01_bin.135]